MLIDNKECKKRNYKSVPSKITCLVPVRKIPILPHCKIVIFNYGFQLYKKPSDKNGLVNVMVKFGTFYYILNDSFHYTDLLTPIIYDVQPRENLNVLGMFSIVKYNFIFVNNSHVNCLSRRPGAQHIHY